MYGSQEDGSIDEDALSSILKTALGVAELAVTDLFRAIDQAGKGRITFGECPGAGTGDSHVYRGDPRRRDMPAAPAPLCPRQHGSSRAASSRTPAGEGRSSRPTSLGGDTRLATVGPRAAVGTVLGLRAGPRPGPGAGANPPPRSAGCWQLLWDVVASSPAATQAGQPRSSGTGAWSLPVEGGAARVPGACLLGAPPSEHVSK